MSKAGSDDAPTRSSYQWVSVNQAAQILANGNMSEVFNAIAHGRMPARVFVQFRNGSGEPCDLPDDVAALFACGQLEVSRSEKRPTAPIFTGPNSALIINNLVDCHVTYRAATVTVRIQTPSEISGIEAMKMRAQKAAADLFKKIPAPTIKAVSAHPDYILAMTEGRSTTLPVSRKTAYQWASAVAPDNVRRGGRPRKSPKT